MRAPYRARFKSAAEEPEDWRRACLDLHILVNVSGVLMCKCGQSYPGVTRKREAEYRQQLHIKEALDNVSNGEVPEEYQ